MNRIANLDRREREELFLATAHDIKLPEAMTEKDFWLCWTLDYLCLDLDPDFGVSFEKYQRKPDGDTGLRDKRYAKISFYDIEGFDNRRTSPGAENFACRSGQKIYGTNQADLEYD